MKFKKLIKDIKHRNHIKQGIEKYIRKLKFEAFLGDLVYQISNPVSGSDGYGQVQGGPNIFALFASLRPSNLFRFTDIINHNQ